MTNEQLKQSILTQLAQYPAEQYAFRLMKLQTQYPDVDLIELLDEHSDD